MQIFKEYIGQNSVSSIFSALILVVAYSRVYLGVHYITDIIGGWLIGFAITLIVYTVCRLTFLKDKTALHIQVN